MMTEPRYSPGPWRPDKTLDSGEVGIRADKHGYAAIIPIGGPNPIWNDHQLGNVSLIAAAPQQDVTLRDVAKYLHNCPMRHPPELTEAVDAAIAAAEQEFAP